MDYISLSFEASEDINAMFQLSVFLLKTDANKAFEQMVREFTAKLIITNSAPQTSQSAFPSYPSKSTQSNTDLCSQSSKALQRIGLWAKKPKQLNHQCIRAFLLCAGDKTEASRTDVKNRFISNGYSEKQFNENMASLSTDFGNSHGRVFSIIGDRIILVDEIKEEMEKYKNDFTDGDQYEH